MTDHKALGFDTLTRLAIEAGLMEPRDTMSSVPAEYAGSICIFAELVAAEVRAKDGEAQAPAVPAVPSATVSAPEGATHYQPHQKAYYKRLAATEWKLWAENRKAWIPSPGSSDSAQWVTLESIQAPQPEAQAPAVPAWKDHDTAKLVNDLRDVAIEFHDSQQLRERIAQIVRPVATLMAQAPAVPAVLKQILLDPENQPNQYGVKFLMRGQKFAFQIGNQRFALDYEPTEPGEFEFMRDMLINAFSTFTPDVKAAPQPEAQAPAVPAWINPCDKSQDRYLPNIGEAVLFKHEGRVYTGKHTGGSFKADFPLGKHFDTWDCVWVYPSVLDDFAAPQPEAAAMTRREQAAQRVREAMGIDPSDVTDPLHPRYIAGFDAGHAAGKKRAAPQPEAAVEADMFWGANDGERFGHDIQDIIAEYGPGDRVKIDCAKRLPSIDVLVVADGEDAFTYQIVDAALAAQGGV
jgi:hypothetical protein